MYCGILQDWHKMEFFSPVWPVDEACVDLAKDGIPWQRADAAKAYVYDVYLGRAQCAALVAWLAGKLEWDEAEAPAGDACFCALRVDATGAYVPGSFSVSGFIWAISHIAAENDVNTSLALADWEAFRRFADEELRARDAIDSISMLASILERIVKKLGLDNTLVRRPCYWARTQPACVGAERADVLYAFGALQDITQAIVERDNPAAQHTRQFAEAAQPADAAKVDLSQARQTLDAATEPLGKWRGENGLPPVGQLALRRTDAVLDVPAQAGNAIALMRQAAAMQVVARADFLSALQEPAQAFTAQSGYFAPDAALTRFSLLYVAQDAQADARAVRALTVQDSPAYFAQCAAALGTPMQRYVFAQTVLQPEGQDLLACLSGEKPDWAQARQEFQAAYTAAAQYREEIAAIQRAYRQAEPLLQVHTEALKAVAAQQAAVDAAEHTAAQAQAQLTQTEQALASQQEGVATLKKSLPQHKKLLPFLFRGDGALEKLEEEHGAIETLSVQLAACREQLAQAQAALAAAQDQLQTLQNQATQAEEACAAHRETLAAGRALLGEGYADADFWDKPEPLHSAWTNAEFDALRETVFEKALQLHKAFALNCAPVAHNLSRLSAAWRGEPDVCAEPTARAALLHTLSLLSPVFCVTLDTAQSFLTGLAPGQIGLALIDEAGQIAPQAALGTILRAQRTILYGGRSAPNQARSPWTIQEGLFKKRPS